MKKIINMIRPSIINDVENVIMCQLDEKKEL